MKIEPKSTLLVIGASDEHDALLRRARQVAKAFRLRVYLFYPLVERAVSAAMPGAAAATAPGAENVEQETRALWHERCQSQMQKQLAGLRSNAVEADGRIEWSPSHVTSVLDAVKEIKPRCVMTSIQPHGRLTDVLMGDDDIELIRLCPAPLWLVKEGAVDCSIVLAAVDPTHEQDQACAIDHAVLDVAGETARELGKELHAFHAYTVPSRMPAVMELTVPDLVEEQHEMVGDHHLQRMGELTSGHGVARERTHVVEGDLVESLESLSKEMDIGLVVTGALSRSRLKRRILGGTAERLIRNVSQDVLVVKGDD